jgi:hypothetical protein
MEGLVGKLEGYGKNRREGVGVAGKGAPGVGSELPRCAGALDRILPHRGQHGSDDSFIGLAPAPARFCGRRCGPVFGLEPNFRVGRVLGGVLGTPVEVLFRGPQF